MGLSLKEQVPLAPYTTINLGGPARYFVAVTSVSELLQSLEEAEKRAVPVHILSGGSNTIFADEGFDGLVIKVDLKGMQWRDEGESVVITAQAGEPWEELAAETVRRKLAGFECLAGIPGSVGATPVQNVGAYGQEVSQTIVKIEALDRQTRELISFSNDECRFSYRMSRFKGDDADRYVIVAVHFRLQKNGAPTLVYQAVTDAAGEKPSLAKVRDVVLGLRKAKSMVFDPNDPHARSCGSFFMNPTLSLPELGELQRRSLQHNAGPVPHFPARPGYVSVPAAWLIERAGWHKGFRQGGVGISDNHPLALVNYGGTTKELLALSHQIEASVSKLLGIVLTREPVVM